MPENEGRSLDRNNSLVEFISTAATREFPEEVKDGARRALVDYLGVTIGAYNDPVSQPARKTVEQWAAPGRSRVVMGGLSNPALAAFANSSAAHAMDYDDTHHMGGGHAGGPNWATVFALTDELDNDSGKALAAFVTGYEIMVRLGGGGVPGVGRSLQRAGLHPTSVFGRSGAAAAASVLMDLDREQIANALGVAATTAGGLLGSFGTHGKPFHSGKAAMDGILAAQLAKNGFIASHALYELESKGGLLRSLLQKEKAVVPPLDFGEKWELLDNSIKLFASCRATHPAAQAAVEGHELAKGKKIDTVHARLHPNTMVAAGNMNPTSALEAKFSVVCCIAMGLSGYSLVYTDFTESMMQDPSVIDLLTRIECEVIPDQPPYEAYLEITFEDGSVEHSNCEIVIGHPRNPVNWTAIERKFLALVNPVLGQAKTGQLYKLAREFDKQPDSLTRISALLAG